MEVARGVGVHTGKLEHWLGKVGQSCWVLNDTGVGRGHSVYNPNEGGVGAHLSQCIPHRKDEAVLPI